MQNENNQVIEPTDNDANIQTPEPTDNEQNVNDSGEAPAKGATAYYKEQFQKAQEALRQHQQQIEEKDKQLKSIEERKLIEQNKWKELAEKYKSDYESTTTELSQFRNDFVNDKKMDAIKREALKHGIRPEAIDDLDMLANDEVEIETTSTGKINILGADSFVEKVKAIKPYWFQELTAPTVNNGQSLNAKPKDYSPSQILKLQKENPKEYNRYMNAQYEKRKNQYQPRI